jgi:hypothetical protein
MAAQHAGALSAGADDADADAVVGAEYAVEVVWTSGAADAGEAGRAVAPTTPTVPARKSRRVGMAFYTTRSGRIVAFGRIPNCQTPTSCG